MMSLSSVSQNTRTESCLLYSGYMETKALSAILNRAWIAPRNRSCVFATHSWWHPAGIFVTIDRLSDINGAEGWQVECNRNWTSGSFQPCRICAEVVRGLRPGDTAWNWPLSSGTRAPSYHHRRSERVRPVRRWTTDSITSADACIVWHGVEYHLTFKRASSVKRSEAIYG